MPSFYSILSKQIFQTPNFEELCSHEIEIKQISPNARWVEQDPLQIIDAVRACYVQAIQKMDNIIPNTYNVKNITTIGVTNQRETVVAWDKYTGEPLYNAIGKLDCIDMAIPKKIAHLYDIRSLIRILYSYTLLI